MRYLIVLFVFVTSASLAQTKPDYSQDVRTLDSTIKTLYAVISGEKGEARDWDKFRYLFHKDAKLIPSSMSENGTVSANYMTPDEYIERAGPWLIENGFYEIEIHRTINTFGHITQVFSTYESFHSKTDKDPFMRGINSIQLLNDGQRWWVINIYWQQENTENPIPTEYLPKQ